MKESTPIADELLAKYIAGEADVAERAEVGSWAMSAAANADELDRMRSLWDLSNGDGAAEVDVDSAWDRLSASIAKAEGGGRVIVLPTWRPQRWTAAAAAVVALLLVARWWSASDGTSYAAAGTYQRITLSDSSAIVLSPGSSLSSRMGRKRLVGLAGEAYFEVAKDAARPFVVDAGEVEVTALGTAFTVSAFDTAAAVIVRVREGRVQVVAAKDTVILLAGQHAVFDRERHFLQREPAPSVEVWGERILHFKDAPLPRVVEQLQRLFDVGIELENAAIANCRLTATFEDEPIDRILTVIAETYGLALTRTADGNYELDGAGCP
ncbi:MAG: FecR domain-containing protein [Flavobacteriales bacterium]|nr:FecR domain-containing protein [Flavobacteriales bacterium]